MKKLFISQPMNGRTDAEIRETREKIIQEVKAIFREDVEVLDSHFEGLSPDAKPLWCLGESLKLLAEADAAYFAKGWEKARGCRVEHRCARLYGTPLIIEGGN